MADRQVVTDSYSISLMKFIEVPILILLLYHVYLYCVNEYFGVVFQTYTV